LRQISVAQVTMGGPNEWNCTERKMNPIDVSAPWSSNWAWGLPLIVLTVVMHVCGLGLIHERVLYALGGAVERRGFLPKFAVVMSVTALLATILHGIEAVIWGAAYRFLGALPDNKTAMLYSLSAMACAFHKPRRFRKY
jgi:hypothetical protein